MNHHEVCEYFARREKSKDKAGHNIYTGKNNSVIYSYGSHFPMAVSNDETKTVILNGDRYSVTTARHQSLLRSAIRQFLPRDYKSIIIPFSVSNRGRGDFNIESVEIIDVAPDREYAECITHKMRFEATATETAYYVLSQHQKEYEYRCHTRYRHLLGESVFKAKTYDVTGETAYSYFISGFDDTHSSNHDGYFISKLPRRARNVEDAYLALTPKEVRKAKAMGLEVKRQGDTFAIPAPHILTRKVANRDKSKMEVKNYWGSEYKKLEHPMLNNSHAASEIGFVKGKMYARGSLIHRPANRNPEHKRITLGKIWHRIVFNTAIGSWSTSGRVD